MHQTLWSRMGLGTLRFVGGEGQSLAQGTRGREPQICFNQPCIQVGAVAECQFAKFSSLFLFSCYHQSHPADLLLCPD